MRLPMKNAATLIGFTLISLVHSVWAVAGGKEAYPVYAPYTDDDGNKIDGSIEFGFALAAINKVRAQCNDTYNFPQLVAEDVVLYDDECSWQIISGQQIITLSFDVPAAVDSVDAIDSIYVLLSNVPPVKDINPSTSALDATKMDVGITVSKAKDPTGLANSFQLLGIRKLDLETGDGNTMWTCSYTKDDGTSVFSIIGNMNISDDESEEDTDTSDTRRRGWHHQSSGGNRANFIPIFGRRQLPELSAGTLIPTRREIIPDNLSPSERKAILDRLPANYDARAPATPVLSGQAPIAATPLDQGSCGSCYAFATTTAAGYRQYQSSKGKFNVVPSPQQVMTCCNGCEGGDADVVHDALVTSYVPATTMQAYTGKVAVADKAFCAANPAANIVTSRIKNSIPYKNKRNTKDSPSIGPPSASTSFLGVEAIMQEIYVNGPGAMYIQVDERNSLMHTYPNNPETCNGILTDRKCITGAIKGADANGRCLGRPGANNHVMTLVGWGVDPVGCPQKGLPGPLYYWIAQNSWGEGWGDCDGVGCGFMKLERGRNALVTEADGMVAGFPDVSHANMCPGSTDVASWCKNGGSFTADCKCYCPPQYGFSGPTCEDCTLTCAGGVKAEKKQPDPLKGKPAKCECPCTKGYWKPENLAGYTGCNIAAGAWAASGTTPKAPTDLNDIVQVGAAPADFKVRFIKIAGADNTAQSPHYGDMLVAVKAGMMPWTKEAGWDSIKGKIDVCGEKKVEAGSNQLINCGTGTAWSNPAVSTGTIRITETGAFDVYFVKYLGKSEFGVDKGYGRDFARLPFRLFVGSVSDAAQLQATIDSQAAANKLEQTARITDINGDKLTKITALQAALEANNSARLALEEQKNSGRSVYFAVILRGLTESAFTMVEETAFKAVLANITSVCSPKKEGKALTGFTNLSSFGDCTVRDVTVQRSARNMTGDISRSDMAIFSFIVAHNTSAVGLGFNQLSRSLSTGSMLRALRTASPRLKAALANVSMYQPPQQVALLINQADLAKQLGSAAAGDVVALVSQPGLAIGMVKGGSAAALDLALFKAFGLNPEQTGVEVMKGIDPKLGGAMRIQDLAPGFGAVRLALALADDFKPLRIALSKVAATARRAVDDTLCRLNKVDLLTCHDCRHVHTWRCLVCRPNADLYQLAPDSLLRARGEACQPTEQQQYLPSTVPRITETKLVSA